MEPGENVDSEVAERRAEDRSRIPYRMDVSDGLGSAAGYLVDISVDGMRVRFRQGLDMGRLEEVQVHFPRWMELGSGVHLTGRFIWCKPFGIGITEGGFVFEELDEETIDKIEALMDVIRRAEREDW